MSRELEIKFLISDPDVIIKKLEKLGAKYHGEAFQKTVAFDSPDGKIKEQGKYLRLRSGFNNVITYKAKVDGASKRFKERKEIEVEVEDIDKLQEILEAVGLVQVHLMEKYRREWTLGEVEVVLDRLPFATYLEIEGSEKDIEKVAKELGLDIGDGNIESYGHIWREYKKEHGLTENNIVFDRK